MNTLKLDEFQSYFDEKTSDKLTLWFGQHNVTIEEISVTLKGVPLLKNENNGQIYFPDKTKHLIKYFVEEAKKSNKPGGILTPKNIEHKRFAFAEKFNFQYSQVDYEYIPGLIRPWDEGFLIPIFFNISVLNKYSQNPAYNLDLFSDTYGNISKNDEWSISFGINKNNRIIMWLGDIDTLPDDEKHYLRSDNIPSDHEIHSEFYDAQIDAKFSEPSKQSLIFHQRKELKDLIQQQFPFDLYLLEGEVSKIISNLHRPIYWEDKHVGPVIESFNRIFVESINIKAIKSDIKSTNQGVNTNDKGSLKIFQLWLEERIGLMNASKLMCPFYVLYDFRIITCHLQSSDTKLKELKSINSRLEIEENNRDNALIYDAIVSKISSSLAEILEQFKHINK